MSDARSVHRESLWGLLPSVIRNHCSKRHSLLPAYVGSYPFWGLLKTGKSCHQDTWKYTHARTHKGPIFTADIIRAF